MKFEGFLTVNNRGTAKFTKNKPGLDWNEISIKINMDIPDQLFSRPTIEASIKIDKNIIPKPQPLEVILNTKELIEESTGAKIDFSVVSSDDGKDNKK